MFAPVRPTIRSKSTAPEDSFAIASSAELYVAISTLVENSFWKLLDGGRVEVVGVVVDPQRAGLGAARRP